MKFASAGFTRIDLAAATVAVALLCSLAVPLLGTTRSDSERAGCMNNLRRIGTAVRLWAGNHEDRVPWLTPLAEGGSLLPSPKALNAYEEWATLTNELVTPRRLVCPADVDAKIADEWFGPKGFLTNPNYGPNALSYLVGLHALPDRPRALISADLNVSGSTWPAACGVVGANNARALRLTPVDPNISWTSRVHAQIGHLLLNDGSVLLTDSSSLRTTLAEAPVNSESSSLHVLPAR